MNEIVDPIASSEPETPTRILPGYLVSAIRAAHADLLYVRYILGGALAALVHAVPELAEDHGAEDDRDAT